MRYLRLQTLGFAALLATLTAIHCIPTEAQADRRRRPWTTYVSASDRLVVECDMRSDTCSDGRRIATTRSTPVPCETSPGVWEMVPEDTACISYRGLESWRANTSYLSWGAELDREPWRSIRGGTLAQVVDGWRVSNDPAQANSGWVYTGGAADEGVTYTVACRVRAETPTTLRVSPLDAGGSDCPLHQVGAEWATVSCTQTAGAGRGERAHIWPGVGQEGPASVIVAACWLTKSDTPGRPCWGGEAPVTCGADRHTISTEGWPTEAGEISVAFVSGDPAAPDRRTLFAGGAASSCRLWTTSSGNLQIANCPGWSTTLTTTTVSIQEGRPYVATIKRRDGKVSIWLDGVMQVESERPPFVWDPSVNLGTTGTQNHLNGSIRSLTVRSFE